MEIGQKLRELREAKHLSQADIRQKTGLLRNYTSRVENGFTVPSVETLEKYAYALGIPLYRFFTNGEAVRAPTLPASRESAWQVGGKHRQELRLFDNAFKYIDERSRRVLLSLAQEMARRHDPPRRIKSKDKKPK
jgi:transcriptional regulator with XRE-family HTH domain